MDQIDQQLPGSFSQLVASFLNIGGALVTIAIATPSFALVMGPIMALYVRVTSFYRHIARELKRIESISRSPVYQQFTETLLGLQVIRSFKRQRQYERRNEVALDDNLGTLFSLKSVDRWLSVRLELLGNSIVYCAALLAVLMGSKGGPAGMSLSNALSITSLLNWAVRNGAETESYMNSVERILYTTEETPSEKNLSIRISETPKRTATATAASIDQQATEQLISSSSKQQQFLSVETDKELRASGWPWHGSIELRGVKMRYREDFDPVLRDVNLSIQAGESLGIVGRTGSGKSSLFRILLRMSELEEGQILIDGVDISKIGLDTLRSCISIIPQDAVLFSGSVR